MLHYMLHQPSETKPSLHVALVHRGYTIYFAHSPCFAAAMAGDQKADNTHLTSLWQTHTVSVINGASDTPPPRQQNSAAGNKRLYDVSTSLQHTYVTKHSPIR